MADEWFWGVVVICVAGAIARSIWDAQRRDKRKKTLRRESDGGYVWIEFDGTPRRSDRHPEKEGGAWYNEPGGDGHDSGHDSGDGGDGGGGD